MYFCFCYIHAGTGNKQLIACMHGMYMHILLIILAINQQDDTQYHRKMWLHAVTIKSI